MTPTPSEAKKTAETVSTRSPPLSAPKSNAQGEQSSAQGGWVGTHGVLLRPSYMPRNTSSAHLGPAERVQIQPHRGKRAQIKRNETKRDGNSRSAPPRPFNMPRDKHVSNLAPLSSPKSNAQGEQSSAQGGRVGTHEHLLPRIHCTCQGRHATSALWPR